MASGLQQLRDKTLKNGGYSNVNCQDNEDDPKCLMEEFCSLHNEKLKALEEQCPGSLEPKCQALTELVRDLTEQNYMLLKAVEDLEREALNRVDAFNKLAEAAKETIEQDTLRRGIEASKSHELEGKIVELQDALKKNESHLSSCMEELDRLTKTLQEKNLECDKLKAAEKRMSELESQVGTLEASVKEKSDLVQSFQSENEQFKTGSGDMKRMEYQLNVLKEELKQKNCLLDKYRSGTYSPFELQCLESNHLTNILTLKDELIEQLLEGGEETKLELMKDTKIVELDNHVKWLQDRLEEKDIQLNKAIEERDCFQIENDKAALCLASQSKRIEELAREIDCLKCIISEKELESRNISSYDYFLESESKQENKESFHIQDRLKEYEEQITYIENTLLEMENEEESRSIELFKQQIKCLQAEIEKKNCEIVTHKDQEENLRFEISRMKTYLCDLERQWQERTRVLEIEIEKKEGLLRIFEKKFDEANLFIDYEQKNFNKSFTASKASHYSIDKDDNSDLNKLKLKLKDVQEALTSEIADKHDEIRRLKDDVKELEEKLLQSDKQTQFKDDIIKELRKEVKIGRAKESLAEMLGLKGTPRAAMKARIDHLTGQLEEMRTHILSLEERLAECNLPAVMSLKSRLNSAEGSLLAMCNKMDYVRRYLENLKGDEELSIKCGLEALLSELRDDVEWNRQTRRNLSLDEGTSVIVISHRSHSLPDNSLHKLISKAKSDSAVAVYKQQQQQQNTQTQHSLESFQECRDYIQVITALENDFEETRKAVMNFWSVIQSYSQGNCNGIGDDLNDMLRLYKNSRRSINEVIENISEVKEEKQPDVLNYNLHCLKTNLLEMSVSLSKAQMITNTSDTSVHMEAGDNNIKWKLATAINDSLSIIKCLENLKSTIICKDKKTSQYVQKNLSDIISLIKPLLEEKGQFYEKLTEIQKIQLEFSQALLDKIAEFDEKLASYHYSAENLKKETKKLFAIILTKEKQIQKQFDEIDNLKMALTSNKYVEEATEEIDSLRKVVSDKDLQLVEKQEFIQNLKHLNQSLRRRQLTQRSPSWSYCTENNEVFLDKSHQLEESLLYIKEKFCLMSTRLLQSTDKLIKFEVETRRLLEALSKVHKHISAVKESSQNTEELSLLETSFTEGEHKVEKLLQALESFIFEEKPDYKDFTETIDNHIETILDIVEFLKKSFENEGKLMTALKDENAEMKQQLDKLKKRFITVSSEQAEGFSRDEFIQSLEEDLLRSNSYLETLQEEYTKLKLEKGEMEEKNQKVMEELQAKICKLQEALQKQAPEAVFNKDEFIQSLEEDLKETNSYLLKIQEDYKRLKLEKGEMEKRNQKVVEELQAKVSTLQEAHQKEAGEFGFTKDELIEGLEEELSRNNSYLEKIQEEYTGLQMEIVKMETRNKSVMEELQAKICELQEALQKQTQESCFGRDEFIENLKEDLDRSNTYLEKIQGEYTNLQLEKVAMEERNKKVVEALQAKVCKLQEALQKKARHIYFTKDEFILSLEEDLTRGNSYLEKIQEEYTKLELEKVAMEERNLEVVEELQAKVCKLQAALEAQTAGADTIFNLNSIVEQQSQRIHQFERQEQDLNHEIFTKNQDLDIKELEINSLKNKLNSINVMYKTLEKHFLNAKEIIDGLEEDKAVKELEIISLKNSLDVVKSTNEQLQKKFQEANEFITTLQKQHNEKESECEELKQQLGYQQQEIESMTEELRIKCDQIKELEISRQISNVGINMQLKELTELKEKVSYWENIMLFLKNEIIDKTDEVKHWHAVSIKQKENLAALIEKNQSLLSIKDEFESSNTLMTYELETNKKKLSELATELVKYEGLVYQLKDEKNAMSHDIAELQDLLREKENLWSENAGKVFVDKEQLREMEEFNDLLLLKIAQMNSFLADRDETITLLENQLKTSTMLMLDLSDVEEEEKRLTYSFTEENFLEVTNSPKEAGYKMKLWQSLEINRRLVTMVDSLQNLNYNLLQEKSNTKQFQMFSAVPGRAIEE